jgi:hypothetical protein
MYDLKIFHSFEVRLQIIKLKNMSFQSCELFLFDIFVIRSDLCTKFHICREKKYVRYHFSADGFPYTGRRYPSFIFWNTLPVFHFQSFSSPHLLMHLVFTYLFWLWGKASISNPKYLQGSGKGWHVFDLY